MTRTWSTYQAAIFEAVEARTSNLQINAVAGSGKTTVIVEAANRLRGREALFCAFNKHNATELQKRLPRNVNATTIHGLGYRTLSAIGRMGAPDTDKYRDETSRLSWSLASAIHGDMPSMAQRRATGDTLKALLHFCRVNLTDPNDRAGLLEMAARYDIDVDAENAGTYAAATNELLTFGVDEARKGRIDFDDMLWLPYRLSLRPRAHDDVFVDEAQDLSRAQLDLVMASLAPGRGRLVSVGDPRQAVYGFAGADAYSFAEIGRRSSALELPLSVCYRCPASVVALAQEYVPQIEAAPNAAAGDVRDIRHEQLFDLVRAGDLVLSRTTARAVKDCLTLLSRQRAARVRGRDIGAKLVGIVEKVKERGGAFHDFVGRLDAFVSWKSERLRGMKNADSQIESLNDMAEALRVCFATFRASTWSDFSRQLADLFADAGNVVWFSTIHRAKGLENDRVFILDFDKLPMTREKQTAEQRTQEANLVYVALTRAMKELYLVESEGRTKPAVTSTLAAAA